MILVLDNNIFSRSFRNLSMEVFDDIWLPWSSLIQEDRIISVDEVLCELRQYWNDESEEGIWLNRHRKCFQGTTNGEGHILASIFKSKKFRDGVKEKSLRNGSPEADAMLVAKAKAVNGIIVTTESGNKPNSEKIPNIAVAFGVPFMGIDSFYQALRNHHHGKLLSDNLTIHHEIRAN